MRSLWVLATRECTSVGQVNDSTAPSADTYTQAIAAELRAEKAATGISYADITAVSGLPEKKLIRIFRGESKSFATDLIMICSAFPHLEVAELLRRAQARVDADE